MKTDENKTALLLTGDEWADLACICDRFLFETSGVEGHEPANAAANVLLRQREIAKRVVEAA